jgi:hypothetical protein
MLRRRLSKRVCRVPHKDVARFPCAAEFLAEPSAHRVVGVRVQVGVEFSSAPAEGIANLFDGCGCRDAELRTRFVEGHAIAVR